MKNKKFWLPILTSLACLLGMIFAPNSVQAKELKNVISNIGIWEVDNGKFIKPDANGVYTLSPEHHNYSNYKFTVDYDLSAYDGKLEDGDTFTFTVPSPLTVRNETFDLKDKETVKETAKEMTNKVNDFVNNVPEGKENFFAIGGGILSILNTLLLAVVTIKVPIFGNYSIGFFKGLGILADFSKEAKNAQAILLFSGILFIAFAGLLIYSSVIRNKNILLYSIIGNVIFLIIFYIILFVKLPDGEVSEYISVSFFKILLYLISLALAFVTYFALNKSEQSQISLNDGDDRNEEGL